MKEQSETPSDSSAARDSMLAAELRGVIGALKRRLREEVRPGELTPSQTSALSRLERNGPVTVTTLARAEGVRPQSMGATIAALEAEGLVQGTPDPSDGRQTLLSLTDACRELIATYRAAREDWLSHAIQSKLAAQEKEELATALELLKRLVDL